MNTFSQSEPLQHFSKVDKMRITVDSYHIINNKIPNIYWSSFNIKELIIRIIRYTNKAALGVLV